MLDTWLQDVRYAIRLLRRNPIFALTAAASLAIGIAATTTIFTIANALLLRPPVAVAEPGRLVDVGRSQNGQASAPTPTRTTSTSAAATSCSPASTPATSSAADEPSAALDGAERVFGHVVTLNYFATLGAATGGRSTVFGPGRRAARRGARLRSVSHRLWQQTVQRRSRGRRAEDRSQWSPVHAHWRCAGRIQGTTILSPDVWVPMNMIAAVNLSRSASILERRESGMAGDGCPTPPGVTLRQAQADLASLGAALERDYPRENRGKGLSRRRVVAHPGQRRADRRVSRRDDGCHRPRADDCLRQRGRRSCWRGPPRAAARLPCGWPSAPDAGG